MSELLSYKELVEAWPLLDAEERVDGFSLLAPEEADWLFDTLPAHEQITLLQQLPPEQRGDRVVYLDPDDAADLIQQADERQKPELLALLDEKTRREVIDLLRYDEDAAGGLMNPRFAHLRPEMTVDEAIASLRRQGPERAENIYYNYVLGPDRKLLGVVSLRELVTAPPGSKLSDVMEHDVITATEDMDQEELSALFARHDLLAVPVVDSQGRMKGMVTFDDIVDVVQEEATEDIQKAGAVQALEAPYLLVTFGQMIRARLGWLAVLLVMGFLTVLAMTSYRETVESVKLLALFVPLIIASGGNAGAQAATLVVRAIALGEVRVGDWWRVVRREFFVGAFLGASMGAIALLGVALWHLVAVTFGLPDFGESYLRLGIAIALSILAVALWGTLVGSILPLALRRAGFDPASASTPLVATIVDATGLVLYFTIAGIMLKDVLL